jgi:hypothetical protein
MWPWHTPTQSFCDGTQFRKLFIRRTQVGTAFRNFSPRIGITNTTTLLRNFGPLFTSQNLSQKKNSPVPVYTVQKAGHISNVQFNDCKQNFQHDKLVAVRSHCFNADDKDWMTKYEKNSFQEHRAGTFACSHTATHTTNELVCFFL